MRFGPKFRWWRHEAEKSIPDVAEYIEVSTGHVSNVEREKAAPFPEQKIRTAGECFELDEEEIDLLVRLANEFWQRFEKAKALAAVLVEHFHKMPENFQAALANLLEPYHDSTLNPASAAQFGLGIDDDVRYSE